MMRLYYSPGASSFPVHVALEMIGAPFALERIVLAEGKQHTPEYRAVNPRGRVPALDLGDGTVLTESVAILLHLAERHPDTRLLPPAGGLDRARCVEWMLFLNTSVMATMGAIFRSERYTDDETVKAGIRAFGTRRLELYAEEIDRLLSRQQEAQEFVGPDGCTVADAYLLYVYRSGWRAGIDMRRFVRWTRHAEAIALVPPVARAMATEGITVHPA